jgi:tryptophan 2,3-dioxygenase
MDERNGTPPANGGSPAEDLRRAMAEPVFNRILKGWVGRGEMQYEVYLKTDTLLNLQYPPGERVCPEELMFQIVHQAQELWLKLINEEGVLLVDDLDRDQLASAGTRAERMTRIQRCLGAEMDVLSTLGPREFQIIRRSLGTGSGQESPGYNRLTSLLGRAIEDAVGRLCERRRISLDDVYAEPSAAPDVQRVCEQLVDFDQAFQEWLVRHFLLVRRTIGVARTVHALDGFPTNALAARMVQPLIPSLWEVRVELTKNWQPDGGYPVGADRKAPPPAVAPGAAGPTEKP